MPAVSWLVNGEELDRESRFKDGNRDIHFADREVEQEKIADNAKKKSFELIDISYIMKINDKILC